MRNILFLVLSVVITTDCSSLLKNYAFKKLDELGLELEPQSMVKSLFRKVDQCMEGGNVTSLPVSSDCLGSIFGLIYPLKKLLVKPYPNLDDAMVDFKKSELARMLDSWGKIPDGVFDGNNHWFGSQHQCNVIPNAKYCLVGTALPEFPRTFGRSILWGTCIPQQCSSQDLKAVLELVAKNSDYKLMFPLEICEKSHEYTEGNIKAISVVSLLVALSVVGALVEAFISEPNTDVRELRKHQNTGIDDKKGSSKADTTAYVHAENGSPKCPFHHCGQYSIEFLSCFSLVRNMSIMLSTKVSKDAVLCLNGVRVLATCLVTLGHFYIGVYAFDRYLFKRMTSKLWFMPIANSPACVDIFFVLSGFLVSYLTLKRLDKKNYLESKDLLSFYVHRYIRLTPSLAMLILSYVYIFPLIHLGPNAMYRNHKKPSSLNCLKYWWTNLLYIHNFYPKLKDSCISWTWYLSADMQMFVVSPLILALMIYSAKRSMGKIMGPFIVSSILIIISFITRAYITYFNNLPSVATYHPSPKKHQEKSYMQYWDYLYIKPYGRFGPYVVGMFLGYIITRRVSISDSKWKRVICAIGWLSSFTVGFLVIYGPFKAYKTRKFSDIENLTYGTFSSVGLAISIAWLTFACHDKQGGIINRFLSWRGWIPLSRMSYGAFLYHPLVCQYFDRVQPRRPHHQLNIIFFVLIGIIAVSYSLGAISCVLIEIPVANVQRKFFPRY